MFDSDAFKQVMRRWASTVTIITTRANDVIHGLTATAFSSLSVNPPEVFVSVYKQTRTHALIARSGVFCVNFLAPEMAHLSDRFAGRQPSNNEDRFQGVRYRAEVTGAPVLDDAVAYLDCKVARAFDAGDHTIFVGEVQAGAVQRPADAPLIYFNGRYHRLGELASNA